MSSNNSRYSESKHFPRVVDVMVGVINEDFFSGTNVTQRKQITLATESNGFRRRPFRFRYTSNVLCLSIGIDERPLVQVDCYNVRMIGGTALCSMVVSSNFISHILYVCPYKDITCQFLWKGFQKPLIVVPRIKFGCKAVTPYQISPSNVGGGVDGTSDQIVHTYFNWYRKSIALLNRLMRWNGRMFDTDHCHIGTTQIRPFFTCRHWTGWW